MNVPRRLPLEQELASLPAPEPPAGLAEAIKREIPFGLRGLPAAPAPGHRPRQYWRLAAALFLTVTGGFLGQRVLRDPPPPAPPERAVVSRAPAPAGRPPLPLPEPAAPTQAPTARPVSRAAAPTVVDLRVRVVDTEGIPLPGATVVLGDTASGRVAVTDNGGVVRFRSLEAGNYPLRGELEGFANVEHPALRVTAGNEVAVELRMPGTVEEAITVTAEAPAPPAAAPPGAAS